MNPYHHDYRTLENGAKVLTYPRKEMNGIGIAVIVRAGSIDESKKINGAAHTLEHLVFRGTEKFSKRDSLIQFENENALNIQNAFTNDFYTQFGGAGLNVDFEKVLTALSELTLHPLLKEKDWKIEQGIILDEYQQRSDSPYFKLFSLLKKIRFKEEYYFLGQDVIGTIDTIKSLSAKEIEEFHHEHYIPENMYIIVVGNVEPQKAHDLILKYFPKEMNKKKTDYTNRKIALDENKHSGFTIKSQYRTDRGYMAFTFPALPMKHETKDAVVVSLISSLLTGRWDSVLWRSLREQKGLVYGVSSGHSYSKYDSTFSVECDFNLKHIEIIIEEMFKSIRELKNGKVEADKLSNEIQNRNKTALLAFDDIDGSVGWLLAEMKTREKIMLPEDYIEIRNTITKNDIVEMARRIFNKENMNAGFVGPIMDPKEFENIVQKHLSI